jgi:uncharacterized protein (TIGR03643 family)
MKPKISSEQASLVVRLAWEDRTSFEEIRERTGLVESQVIDLMRRELKPASFRCWRRRVSGRVTKHRKLLELRLIKRGSKVQRIADQKCVTSGRLNRCWVCSSRPR